MDATYQYVGEPLQAAIAKHLVLEVLRESNSTMQRADIALEVLRRHLGRGGAPARQAKGDLIKRALWYLEEECLIERAGGNGRWRLVDRTDCTTDTSSNVPLIDDTPDDCADVIHEGVVVGQGSERVYLYFLRNDRELAQLKGREVWECKIGRTTATDSRDRILNPRCGFAHPPIVGLEILTDSSAALERELHNHLREIDAEVEDSPGTEWFFTSPARVQQWFALRERQLEALRSDVRPSNVS